MKPCVCGRVGCRILSHQFAINTEIKKSPAINAAAINSNGETPLDQLLIPVATVPAVVGVDRPERRSSNRRLVSDYNDYMRLYMATRRAVKSGRAEPWPREVS